MKLLVLSDLQKEMHWVVNIISPAKVKIPKHGNLALQVEIIGFSKTVAGAEVRMAKEKSKLEAA